MALLAPTTKPLDAISADIRQDSIRHHKAMLKQYEYAHRTLIAKGKQHAAASMQAEADYQRRALQLLADNPTMWWVFRKDCS